MLLHRGTIWAMAKAGISFASNIDWVGGGKTLLLVPEDIPDFVADRDQFAADHLGVGKDDYRGWIETDGTPRCGAMTKGGNRCRNVVSGGGQLGIKAWLELDGGFCTVHGGETSEEASPKRSKRHRDF